MENAKMKLGSFTDDELIEEIKYRAKAGGTFRHFLTNIIKYCEDHAIYDKLGQYDDFYYKLKKML